MSTIGKIFGRSPFGQVQTHMDQVAKCISKMSEAVDAMLAGRFDELEGIASEVSGLEHQADQIKVDIRNHLLRRFFMPIDRGEVLEILSMQDSLADTAEDFCKVITLKKLPFPEGVREDFESFKELNIKAFELVASIISELDELIESGFGGAEAEKIRALAHDVAFTEHQADKVLLTLLRKIYANDDKMSFGEFHLWMRMTRELNRIANISENLANRIMRTMSVK